MHVIEAPKPAHADKLKSDIGLPNIVKSVRFGLVAQRHPPITSR
jgi:hypothetical protein